MAVVDDEGLVRHWNPSLAALLGRPASAALGDGFERVLPPALHPHVRRALATGGKGGGVRAFRVRVPKAGEGELSLNFSATTLIGPDGPDGLLLSLDDVTDQARLEQQLIQQDRLASVGMLAAGVAHEVNTPLTGISSYAQIILEEAKEGDPRRPVLEKIVVQAERASRIARGLLSISRPGGEEGVSLGPVDLFDLAEETVGLLGSQTRSAGAAVRVESPGDAIVASADRPRLQQVLMNLLLNALDAVQPGGEVVIRALVDAADHPCLEVQDDGVGISDEVRDRIFDPFFTTKERGRGTGLGLSISYAIVREHGGRLEVNSEPGRGTLLRIKLPKGVEARPARRAS